LAPSRHSAAKQHVGRFRRKADINRQAKQAGWVANDPERTSFRAASPRPQEPATSAEL
jgi:hypothetical protein